ncbi:MAG: N-acetylglucosamine-6-phosphate deacetylase [Candidatus Eremiobacteraeota bacterium]|nr:N-acetylglucosamine-6-phosphate deacetylase [Candidatus Eremiobacteraeota bacterium]MBC5803890.1 N-acetylglucosamine-6-phosphate deacetylase [Candidatus Eremiobacteraeota bacterium]MBC5821386.1 N-acetylglucosamine-6-phosphate deacetylase [Candidatus Eremiobacteraeota bacterium]
MARSFTLGPARIAVGTGDASFGRLRVSNGRIADILSAEGPTSVPLPAGTTISPGLIDVHTNGARDALFNREQGAAVDVAARAYAAAGATGFVATIMTAPWESMLHAAREVAEAAHERAERPVIGARCLGIHFEGPFLNNKFRRVHRHDWLLPADPQRARALVEACRGALVMVTMAPEVEGVDDCTRFFFDQGIVCSAGHTAAKYGDGMLAIALGFRSLTHAFNAMPPLDHREPSLLAAFIQERRTSVQVICDGHHVAPVMIDVLYRAVGERLVLATDYMAPAGEGYRIEGGVVRAEDGTIAGAALQVDQALRNLMSYASLPFERAIVSATAAPARLLGIDGECGTLERGKRADLTLWDRDYAVIATLVGGEPVYGSARFAGEPGESGHRFGNTAHAASF